MLLLTSSISVCAVNLTSIVGAQCALGLLNVHNCIIFKISVDSYSISPVGLLPQIKSVQNLMHTYSAVNISIIYIDHFIDYFLKQNKL